LSLVVSRFLSSRDLYNIFYIFKKKTKDERRKKKKGMARARTCRSRAIIQRAHNNNSNEKMEIKMHNFFQLFPLVLPLTSCTTVTVQQQQQESVERGNTFPAPDAPSPSLFFYLSSPLRTLVRMCNK
jgi:hypothetical protein